MVICHLELTAPHKSVGIGWQLLAWRTCRPCWRYLAFALILCVFPLCLSISISKLFHYTPFPLNILSLNRMLEYAMFVFYSQRTTLRRRQPNERTNEHSRTKSSSSVIVGRHNDVARYYLWLSVWTFGPCGLHGCKNRPPLFSDRRS